MKSLSLFISTAVALVIITGSHAFALDSEKAIFSSSRKAFKTGDYQRSVEILNLINKSSLRWPLAKEEKAWAYFRLKNFALAMSEIRSLTNDYMNYHIDLEPYLLQSLILLYNCDYKSIFKVIKELKTTMSPYVIAMESMSTGRFNADQSNALNILIKRESFKQLTPKQMNQLPRRFYLDKTVNAAIKSGNMYSLKDRMVSLADKDDMKNQKMLQYLHLIEVEAIQRAFVPNQFNGMAKTKVNKDRNTMVFNNDQELWADEIDKTQADLNICASKTGKTL
jgi:hypothetical protein